MNVLGSIKSKGHYLSGKLFYKQGESIFFASYSYILHGMLVIRNACTHNFLQNAWNIGCHKVQKKCPFFVKIIYLKTLGGIASGMVIWRGRI